MQFSFLLVCFVGLFGCTLVQSAPVSVEPSADTPATTEPVLATVPATTMTLCQQDEKAADNHMSMNAPQRRNLMIVGHLLRRFYDIVNSSAEHQSFYEQVKQYQLGCLAAPPATLYADLQDTEKCVTPHTDSVEAIHQFLKSEAVTLRELRQALIQITQAYENCQLTELWASTECVCPMNNDPKISHYFEKMDSIHCAGQLWTF